MMPEYLSPSDVYRLDKNSEFLGVDTLLLMENAGKNVADFVASKFRDKRRIAVICGTGNNGGDGFVAARHLASMNYDVTVVLMGKPSLIRSEIARKNYEILRRMIFSIKIIEIDDSSKIHKLEEVLEKVDVVVDALLGVGIKGSARGLALEAIRKINKLKNQVGFKIVSIDVPSGFNVFEGRKTGETVNADYTITFHEAKKGFDKEEVGKVIIRSIGIPPEADLLVGPGDVINCLKKRTEWSHKGDFGRILIIGGSKDYSGAPALAAMAALRTGADLVIVAAPELISNVIRSFSPNLIVKPLPGDSLGLENIDLLKPIISNFDTVVLGPGIGLAEETLEAAADLARFIASKGIPLLIDADGLKAIAKHGIPSGKIVVTPHAGEFNILFGEKPPLELKDRGEITRKMAENHGITIILKGHIDVISDGKTIKFNTTGNPGMTVGGTGDVLSGITAAFMAQCNDLFLASCAGAFVSGYAGDLAFRKKSYELLATDVIDEIPSALRDIRGT